MSLDVGTFDAVLARIPLPAAVVDLAACSSDPLQSRIVAANEACDRLIVEAGRTVVGRSLREFTASDRVEIARENLNGLKTRMEGYQVLGRAVADDGREFSARYWVRRLDLDDGSALAAIIILPEHMMSHPLEESIAVRNETGVGFVVTDHDWRIEYRNNDVQARLGEAEASIGSPLLGSVHPSDVPTFTLAVMQATKSRRAVVGRGRFRESALTWWDTVYLVSALDEHEPPRLGLVLGVPSKEPKVDIRTNSAEWQHVLRRIEMEVRTADVVAAGNSTMPTERVRLLGELSERQLEVVTRLLNGERVPAIAKAMYLSPSTVRNHLTAVFRRFGVHSQVELISLLKSTSGPSA